MLRVIILLLSVNSFALGAEAPPEAEREVVAELIRKLGSDDFRKRDAASKWARMGGVKLLIGAGANVNARANDGSTALHKAATIGKIEIIRLLLQAGADPSVNDKKGRSPADVAMSEVGKPKDLSVGHKQSRELITQLLRVAEEKRKP